jgi:hypothetical protein
MEVLIQLLLAGAIQSSIVYRDPSHWRKILGLRLSEADKKHNKMVSSGKEKGRINAKHLSVKLANELFGLNLILKNNNESDSILLGWSYIQEGKK